jgi:hypothetical protein
MEVYFIVKHFICDFILQRPYQYLNKGTYGHLGGVLHATIHSVATFCVLAYFNVAIELAIIWAYFDGVTHYHIDWGKVKLCKRFNLTPINSEVYWILLGLDQLLHYIVYYIIWSNT